jgi:molybdopterin synthase catalytic subunit
LAIQPAVQSLFSLAWSVIRMLAAKSLHFRIQPTQARKDACLRFLRHRVGELQVGDVAVVCGVTSAHRDVAFSVCSALIEEVKAQVPIWKNETFKDGSNVWIGVS